MGTTPGWLRFVLTFGLMAALLALSIIPGRAEEGDSVFVWAVAVTPSAIQNAGHVLLYALLAFMWAWALEAVRSVRLRLAIALVIAVGFGAALEYAQTFIPGRFGTLGDVTRNAAGAITGLILALFLL
jgi:hypothetical protein